jgi:Flp pilus assembly pilin Flp
MRSEKSIRRPFFSDRRGAAAVEFALISIPFFGITFGMIEILIIFVVTNTLENGIDQAAMRIKTGEWTAESVSQTVVKETICGGLSPVLNCDDALVLDVRPLDPEAPPPDALAQAAMGDEGSGTSTAAQADFDTGEAEDVVVLRAMFGWSLVTPILSAPLANLPDNQRLIVATRTFTNEAFE